MFNNVSFKLYKGEILGVAGLIGAGRTEVMQVTLERILMTAGSA